MDSVSLSGECRCLDKGPCRLALGASCPGGVGDDLDDADEAFGLPGSAADEEAVDIFDGENGRAVLRGDGAAIEDAGLGRRRFAVMSVQGLSQSTVAFSDVVGGGGFGPADGPTRLVGQDNVRDVFSTLPARVLLMRRVPPDCALLVFAVCCMAACTLRSGIRQVEQKQMARNAGGCCINSKTLL